MKLLKDFALGALYLVSGIYSVGFSIVMTGIVRPLSGRTAYIPVPDGLFPIEVVTFVVFGVLFVAASFYQFRMTFQALSVGQAKYSAKSNLR